ncbi:DUF6591 domain-containing protein [Adlercreutzia sp. R21]|uniref:DUF6591 domain-containing protein n=1 Tax=Adlercreutzia wanghongyangiae TaxID=3111451 RepID=UPI002DB9DEF6|nr:DUF6591 domain-containing protein [Adlercreutzia sp. R21]MEC4184954.1 DUF6591 domain-containing protein [Adlercreutzia sp. R21]
MNLSTLSNLRKVLLALTIICFAAGVAIAPACDRAAVSNYRHDPTEHFGEMQWPDRGMGALLPVPESTYGVIYNNTSEWFNGDVGDYDKSQYDAYVAACEDAGFIEGYIKNDDSYWAWNSEGYYVHLGFDKDKGYMSFSLEAPKEGNVQEDSSNGEDGQSENAESAGEEAPVEETESNPDATSGSEALGEVTPSFKEYMDSYEAFFDEYVAFMEKYEAADDLTLEMLNDFNTYMERYNEMTTKMNEVDTDTLSPADLAYYNEVNARVYEKLYALEGDTV